MQLMRLSVGVPVRSSLLTVGMSPVGPGEEVPFPSWQLFGFPTEDSYGTSSALLGLTAALRLTMMGMGKQWFLPARGI